jgi:hypothetical protein
MLDGRGIVRDIAKGISQSTGSQNQSMGLVAYYHRHYEDALGTDCTIFSRDDKACREILESNIYWSLFPWQAGHQKRISMSIYGLDAAFPGGNQPELLRLYRRISRIWHHWLGLLEDDDELEDNGLSMVVRKRQKSTNSETQTTPKESAWLDIHVGDSPLTKSLLEDAREAEEMLKRMKTGIEIRRQIRDRLNNSEM